MPEAKRGRASPAAGLLGPGGGGGGGPLGRALLLVPLLLGGMALLLQVREKGRDGDDGGHSARARPRGASQLTLFPLSLFLPQWTATLPTTSPSLMAELER
jgi:hypothetical protein